MHSIILCLENWSIFAIATSNFLLLLSLNFQIKIIGKQVSKDGKEFGEESNFFIDFSIPNSFIIGTSTSEPSQSPTVSQPVAAPQQSNVQSTQTVPVKPDEKTLDGQIAR